MHEKRLTVLPLAKAMECDEKMIETNGEKCDTLPQDRFLCISENKTDTGKVFEATGGKEQR